MNANWCVISMCGHFLHFINCFIFIVSLISALTAAMIRLPDINLVGFSVFRVYENKLCTIGVDQHLG